MSLRNPFAMQRPEVPISVRIGSGDPVIQKDWYLFLVNIYNAVTQGAPQSEEAIPVGASPFTYQAVIRGQVLISGGSVSSIEFSRNGSTFYPAGITEGFVQMDRNDYVRVTYAVAPSIVYFPM